MKKLKKSEAMVHDAAAAAANIKLPILGGALYKVAKRLYESRAEKSFEAFVMRAFDGNATEKDIKEIEKSEAGECLATILDRVQRDDEVVKAKVYADAFKAVAEKRIEERFKWPFVLAICELRFDDLVALCCIVSESKKQGDRQQQAAEKANKNKEEVFEAKQRGKASGAGQYTKGYDALQHGSTQRLLTAGLLRPGDGNRPPMANDMGNLVYSTLKGVVGELHHERTKFKPKNIMQLGNAEAGWVPTDAPSDGWPFSLDWPDLESNNPIL